MTFFGPVWTMPVVLGLLTIVGLVSALLGDGVWDALSAVTLGAVVAVGAYYSLRRPRAPHKVSHKSHARPGVRHS